MVRPGESGGDGQADAAAGGLSAVATAPQPVEHMPLIICCDTRSGVADLEPDPVTGHRQAERDLPGVNFSALLSRLVMT